MMVVTQKNSDFPPLSSSWLLGSMMIKEKKSCAPRVSLNFFPAAALLVGLKIKVVDGQALVAQAIKLAYGERPCEFNRQ